MVQIIQENRKPSFREQLMGGVDAAMPQIQGYLQKRNQSSALNEMMPGMGESISNLPPELQKLAFEYSLKSGMEKSKNIASLQGNQSILRDLEERRGLPKGSLDTYQNDPKMAEQVTRPTKEPRKTQASQPIDPDQLDRIQKVRSSEGYEDASPPRKYQMLTDAGVSKENAHAEADIYSKQEDINRRSLDKSYTAQEDFINKTTDTYKGFETDMKPRLLQMRNIPDDELIGPTAAVFLDHLGIPLGALENPASELYNKLSQDLLKGLPETYGSRILKVEVDNFLKTIPTLLNSADGRRMIASNMLKLGEMKEVYYNAMRQQQTDALDNNKPLPKDFQQRVFDQVKPQIDRINNEFVKLSDIKSVPENTIPFFSPSGEIEFVPKEHAQWAMENGGRRIW